jgi:hypothetical protein
MDCYVCGAYNFTNFIIQLILVTQIFKELVYGGFL